MFCEMRRIHWRPTNFQEVRVFCDSVPARAPHHNVRGESLIYGGKATFCQGLWLIPANKLRFGEGPSFPVPGDNAVFGLSLTGCHHPGTLSDRPRAARRIRAFFTDGLRLAMSKPLAFPGLAEFAAAT